MNLIEVTLNTANPPFQPDRKWKATVMVPKSIPWKSGVNGILTEPGPFVEGYGWNPESAIASAYKAIGQAVLYLHEEGKE